MEHARKARMKASIAHAQKDITHPFVPVSICTSYSNITIRFKILLVGFRYVIAGKSIKSLKKKHTLS